MPVPAEWEPLAEIVRMMVRPEELISITVDQVPWHNVCGTYPGEQELWLHAMAIGDRFDWGIVHAGVQETDEHRRERLISDLQDWIAESSFGWGELRQPGDALKPLPRPKPLPGLKSPPRRR